MTTLSAVLRRRIATTGPLTVAEYMAEALGHPRFGYYATRDPFGAAGDFVTAPEVSQMFGELLGLWCVDAWQRLGAPGPVALVELGPGRGTLMADALRAARLVPGFLAAVRVQLVEPSPLLRRAQAAALKPAGLAVPPAWHTSLGEVPEGPLLVLANEVFDALPVRQFVRTESGWAERMVDWDEAAGRLRWVLAGPVGAAAALIPPDRDTLPPGRVVEVCPAGLSLAAELGRRVASHGGAVLIVDYGYAAPGPGETLQAVRRHAFADPLADPGEADLTAHVDFAALAQSAREQGAAVHGPVAQGTLLQRLGIGQRAARLAAAAGTAEAEAVAAALHRLTAPEQMGTLFKALAIATPALGAPAGFEAGPAPPGRGP